MAGSRPRNAEASTLKTDKSMLRHAAKLTLPKSAEPAPVVSPAIVRKQKLRRAEKAEANRRALIYAAVEVIGESGYNGASIGRITERAGLASGTFYIYFDSRQALFDILLPEIARDALQYLSPFVHGSADLLDLEERGLSGVVQWDQKNPGFSRLRSEAEVAAPAAFQTYLKEILSHYIPALERGQAQGVFTRIRSEGTNYYRTYVNGRPPLPWIQFRQERHNPEMGGRHLHAIRERGVCSLSSNQLKRCPDRPLRRLKKLAVKD